MTLLDRSSGARTNRGAKKFFNFRLFARLCARWIHVRPCRWKRHDESATLQIPPSYLNFRPTLFLKETH